MISRADTSCFTFDQVMQTLMSLDEWRSTCERAQGIRRETLYTVRAAFLRLLLHVYVDTRVASLLQEQRRQGNGMWAWTHADAAVCRSPPLMRTLARELTGFAAGCHEAASWAHVSAEEKDYFFGAVVSLLTFYYRDNYATTREKGETDSKVAEEMLAAVDSLFSVKFDDVAGACLICELRDEGIVDCRERLFVLSKAMVAEGGIRPSGRAPEAYHKVCMRPVDGNTVTLSP